MRQGLSAAEGSPEVMRKLESGAGVRVQEAWMYGIALGAADMVERWATEIEFLPERVRAVRIHLTALLAVLDGRGQANRPAVDA
jgi:hypothetical protein